MVLFGNMNDIATTKCDEVWCIVRNLKDGLPHAECIVRHIPELSPSWELYSQYCKYKKALKWTQKMFDEWYTPRFLEEMQKSEAIFALDILIENAKEKDILCVCYCPLENMCHRKLIKKLVDERTGTLKKHFYCLVAGSRTFSDYPLLCNKLDKLLVNFAPEVTIVSGGARGADMLAEQYAKERGYEMRVFPADWSLGKRAGMIRNRLMHEYISRFPHRGVLCFWDGESKGTANNFQLAEVYKNSLKVVRFDKKEA